MKVDCERIISRMIAGYLHLYVGRHNKLKQPPPRLAQAVIQHLCQTPVHLVTQFMIRFDHLAQFGAINGDRMHVC